MYLQLPLPLLIQIKKNASFTFTESINVGKLVCRQNMHTNLNSDEIYCNKPFKKEIKIRHGKRKSNVTTVLDINYQETYIGIQRKVYKNKYDKHFNSII